MSKESRHNWRHNSLLGATAMSIASMRRIEASPTATKFQKEQAKKIERDLTALAADIKTSRVNLDGEIVEIK